MKLVNSRSKGNNFENHVAKMLTDWAGFKFERVPLSGGLHWKEENNITGDIVPPARLNFPVSVECKKVETDWELDKLLSGSSMLWSFWAQAKRDSVQYTPKHPWLIFCKNRRAVHIMLDASYHHYLTKRVPGYTALPYIFVDSSTSKLDVNVCILNFADFLSSVPLSKVLEYSVTVKN